MIYRTMLKSKIHRATVTEADIHYAGSITIDAQLMDAADILEHEKVQVLDLSNGNRLETYAIRGERDSGRICINGAAAKLVKKGDMIIIVSYVSVADDRASGFPAKVVLVDGENHVSAIKEKGEAFDLC
jgi:aspartate 1-decarboxylase